MGGNRYQLFTVSGEFNVPQSVSSVRILAVGAGGNGGNGLRGGGGAGQLRKATVKVSPLSIVNVTVGQPVPATWKPIEVEGRFSQFGIWKADGGHLAENETGGSGSSGGGAFGRCAANGGANGGTGGTDGESSQTAAGGKGNGTITFNYFISGFKYDIYCW